MRRARGREHTRGREREREREREKGWVVGIGGSEREAKGMEVNN